MTKKPHEIDQYVGSRVRLRRMQIGMSQEKLGEALGLTFQQVQKYEKGVNRIGGSRLWRISQVLDVPVSFFFDGLPSEGKPIDLAESPAFKFLNTREGLELNQAFTAIADPAHRRAVLNLVRALTEPAIQERAA